MGNDTSIAFSDQELIRANSFITSKYKSSLLENKLLALSLYYIQQGNGKLTTRFTTTQLINQLGLKKSSAIYNQIRDTAAGIVDHKFMIDEPEKAMFSIYAVVTSAEYDHGILTIEFNEKIKPFIFQLQSSYTPMRLSILMSLGAEKDGGKRTKQKSYTYRIYEILRTSKYHLTKYRTTYSIRYDLADFKFTIGMVDIDDPKIRKALNSGMDPNEIIEKYCDDSQKQYYKRWSDFKDRVLVPAQQEIAEKTDIRFEFEAERGKRGGKVLALIFHISKNDRYVDSEPNDPTLDMIDKVSELIDEPIKVAEIKKLLAVSGNDYERIKKAYFLSKQQSEPINNLVGWLIKAIEEDWAQNSVKTVRGLGYSQIADYTNEVIVDAVEVPPKKKPKTRTTKKNSFNDFEQRDYDYDGLEKQLLKTGQS